MNFRGLLWQQLAEPPPSGLNIFKSSTISLKNKIIELQILENLFESVP